MPNPNNVIYIASVAVSPAAWNDRPLKIGLASLIVLLLISPIKCEGKIARNSGRSGDTTGEAFLIAQG